LLQLFTSTFPWGVLSEKHIYQLVVYENSRPDRPDPAVEARVGLTDNIWGIIEESWHKESRLRPSFDIIIRLWQQNTTVNVAARGKRQHSLNVLNPTNPSEMESLASRFNDMSTGVVRSPTQSIRSLDSGPPAYEASTSMASPSAYPVLPESAPARFDTSPPPPFGRDSPRSTGSISPQPSGRPASLPSLSHRESRHRPSNFGMLFDGVSNYSHF
ncbi:hypothetical protein IW261DRAFT_1345134, partial [Armillaria novae-zelandiae]